MRRTSAGLTAVWLLTLCALAVLNASCAIRLAADYDEQIDQAATALQQEMDGHLTKLELLGAKPAAAFAEHEEFYADYGVKLRSVRVRAQGHAKNDISLQQLDNMANSLIELRDQHKRGGTLSAGFITATRELFNAGWAAVIKWEIAKKRGR